MTAKRAWLHGYGGRMGNAIRSLATEEGRLEIVGGSDAHGVHVGERNLPLADLASALASAKPDVLIDFSLPSGNETLRQAYSTFDGKGAVLIGTTGLAKESITAWADLVQRKSGRLLVAPNTSLGILLLAKAAREMARVLSPKGFDIELVETHHRHKIDAPSGTAHFLAEQMIEAETGLSVQCSRQGKRLQKEIGIHAVRGGNVFGEHVIHFMGAEEELTISHRALSRTLFARGAIEIAIWLMNSAPGHYSVEQIEL